MEGGEFSIWTSGVWIIPLILAVTIGGLYLMVRHWRKQAVQDLKKMRTELRRLQTRRRELTIAMEGHSPGDPEPYGSQITALQNQLDELDTHITELEYHHVDFQERIHHLSNNNFQTIAGAPYFWYQIRRDLQKMWLLLNQHDQSLAAAQESHQKLTRLGLEIANHARKVQELESKTVQLLEHLRSRNLQGQALQEATQHLEQIHTNLAQIPILYLSGDEKAILEQTDKTSVTQAHQILEKAQPALEQIYAQAEAWTKQLSTTLAKVTNLRQLLIGSENLLDTMPPALVLTEIQGRYQNLTAAAHKLHTRLAKPELESLDNLYGEAERLVLIAQEITGQLMKIRGRQTNLEQVLPELLAGIKRIAALYAALGTNRTHPVIWNLSSTRLTALSQQANALGASQKPRTPEQLEQDVAVATRLNVEQKNLADYCNQIAAQHKDLLDLLATQELSQSGEWFQNAQRLIGQVSQYDPENWLRIDAVTTLPAGMADLAEGFKALVPAGKIEPLQETDIQLRLETVHKLFQAVQAMRARLTNIQKRLIEIQQVETQAQQQLEQTQMLFHQITLLVGSNPLLSDLAGQEPARFKSGLEQAAEELENSQTGTVEKKAKAIDSLANKVETSCNLWLDHLNQDIRESIQELSGDLADLEQVAMLEDPVVDEAHRLLSIGPSIGVSEHHPKARFKLTELVNEMKRRSDYWQSLEATLNALGDIQSPVMIANEQVNQARQVVQEDLAEVTAWIKQSRGWPPTTIDLRQERQELNQLEEAREALKRKPMKAISMVGQLGVLASRYQSLGEKVRQASDKVARESEEIDRLENELAGYIQTWQNHWHARRDNALASAEIQTLLQNADHDLDQLHQQGQQHRLTYDQALQLLKALHMKVRLHQIPLDDAHLMNMTGRISTYKPGNG